MVSDLYVPGTDGNRRSLEKHHLFPKKYLLSLNYTQNQINQVANYAYIDWKDNMEILRKTYAEINVPIFETFIPLSTKLPESDRRGKSIFAYAKKSSASSVFMDFVKKHRYLKIV